jgi:hypothetical protein
MASKYTNPTGEGYLSTYSVGRNVRLSLKSVGFDRGETVFVAESGRGTVVICPDRPDDRDCIKTDTVDETGYIGLCGDTLARLGLDRGDGGDIRLYEFDDGAIEVVRADDDPRLAAVNGGRR